MSGVESLVYGSSGSGGAKLPFNLLHLSGSIKDEAVDWDAGATCIAVLEMNVDSTAVADDIQISGGLWATATGFEFRDGTNVAVLAANFGDGDTINLALEISSGAMRLGRL